MTILDRLRNPTDAEVWEIMKAQDASPTMRDRGFSKIKVALAKFADIIEEDGGWPWCEVCTSYHHPDNPTCMKLQSDGVTMVSEQAIPVVDRLMELGAVVTPHGSRVTCNPPPTDTDEDFLVFCSSEIIVGEVFYYLIENRFKWEGSEHYQDVARNTFMSWRKDHINLIVTANADFRDKHHVATNLCKRLNLMNKADRVALFQAVIYGKGE